MNNILRSALALLIALLLVVPALAEEAAAPGGVETILPGDAGAVETEVLDAIDEVIGAECVDQEIAETAEAELGGEEPIDEAAALPLAEAGSENAEVAEVQAEAPANAEPETPAASETPAATGEVVDSAAAAPSEAASIVPVATNVEKVAFSKKKIKKRTIKAGGTLNLGAAVRFTPKTEVAPLTWTSSDPGVASVDETGVVTGMSKGVATITAATTDGKAAQTDVRVKRNNTVVFFGDSLTKGGRWKSYFKIRKTVNMGIVGDTIEQIDERVGKVAALRPEKVFLEGGINSLMRESYDASLKAYEKLLDDVQSQLTGVPVYVISVLPISVEMEKYGCTNADIVKFNAEIEKLAAARGFTFVDVHSSYVKNGVLNPKLTVDGLHLKKRAYKFWKKAIKSYVK
ncbi:MAG: Ig-like domain-containing protein [Clostridia bacterium]|nr:Ig-like domain-containing protein [Clostridia bacterium]